MFVPIRAAASIAALMLAVGAPAVPGARAAAPDALAAARSLELHGRYAEARAAYARLAPQDHVNAAVGVARCQAATGDGDGARRTLRDAIAREPRAAAARAALAGLEFDRGDRAAAQAQADSALLEDPDQPAARWWSAELHRVAGRLDEANEGYLWFVRFYNREQDRIQDPEVLRWVGLAGAQNARWNRNSGQFDFLVNSLYPDALKRDSTYWPAHLDEALLFIEKYNPRDAGSEIDAGLRINPRAAELHAARALVALQEFDLDSARAAIDRALAIDPQLAVAHRLRADAAMLGAGPRAALPILEQARALDPLDEETLGRIAAAYAAIDAAPAGTTSPRVQSLVAEVSRRNPHCGEFFAAMGASLDLMSKLPAAAEAFDEARRRMPQLVSVPGQLGLEYMKLAQEDSARVILKEAFAIDPFNRRVRNSMRVLELLQGYGTIETPHFTVRFDAARDSTLARTASDTLEKGIYPEVVKTFGFAPARKTPIEIFTGNGKNSGHTWFSMRMAGVPYIGTVGASTGAMLAIASPGEGGFEWARVLKHEFVHIVNIQQTNFNVPRWYTEGLAVRAEGTDHPAIWDTVLVHRVAVKELFDLDTIHLGFLRPASGADWALAYYQAKLYVDYIASAYGPAANGKLIAAYKARLETRAALKQCFGVDQTEFEKGYRAYVAEIARGPKAR